MPNIPVDRGDARRGRGRARSPGRMAGGLGGGRAWWQAGHVLDSAGRCRNWTRDEPHRRVAGHAALNLPGINLIAEPGRRRAALDLAREIEHRGFAMIQVSSSYANMAQCMGLALATERIAFATAIAPIYAQTAEEFAHGAAYIHEVSGGRFQFGIGVAHGPSYVRMGVTPGKPLGDISAFVAKYRAYENVGGLPPIVLATLRRRMIALAGEIADGMVFANGSRSHMADSLAALPPEKRSDPAFFIGNRIRT